MARRYRGSIRYVHDEHGERGREWFHRTDDGGVTLQAVTEMTATRFHREVTLALDEQYRPLDCSIRSTTAGQTHLAWFLFGESEIQCEAVHHDLGRISQRVNVADRAVYFGAHPVCNDVLVAAAYDATQGGRQAVDAYLTTSRIIGSATGPLIYRHQIPIAELGRATIDVPAGRYDTRHIRIFYSPGWHQDCWLTDDYVFVKVRNDEYRTTYLLTDLDTIG